MDNQERIQLSVNCAKCGAVNRFSKNSIPTFCSFCGATLPNMAPHVDEAIRIELERQRHEMNMEKEDKEIRKEKLKYTAQKIKSTADIMGIVLKIIVLIIVTIVFLSAMNDIHHLFG